ncbi:MAG: G8 domain-containing protein [Gemmatimonadales bacterium]
MSRAVAIRLRLTLATSILVAGCATEDTTEPNSPPPSPPPAGPATTFDWSDPAAWPGGSVPAAGADVMIPAGRTIVLDVSPPPLGGVTIDGVLRFADRDVDLAARWIVVHGTLRAGTEAAPYRNRAVITLTGPATDEIEGMGARVLGVPGGNLELHGEPRTVWTRLSQTAAAGATQLELESVVDWRPGDRIVVASTDFDPFQAEEVVVASVQGTRVQLETALKHTHWGTLQDYGGRTLDERAEVGLLGRNLTIRGDPASTSDGFGGHVLVMQGGVAHVENVELTLMGQRSALARYPMHWHLSGSVPGQYFRNNSVWKTFNRCLTIHGTNDLVASGNVCYDNLGHALFLEDGAETGNKIEGNLGHATRRPTNGQEVLPSDLTPATFWITNPDNVVRGNVAAGSRGFGFWYALPTSPTGLSVGSPLKPRATPLGEFRDNVAHSNRNTGLNVDHGPRLDGHTETAHYAPRQVPGDNSTPLVTARFVNFTGYKHSGRAVWLRGSELRLEGAILADNHIGATFASSETFLEDAVLVARSANGQTGFSGGFPVRGYEFYDGRVGADHVTFVGYQPMGSNYMSALGFNRANGFPVSIGNFGRNLTFVGSNSVFLENPAADKDGDKAAAILDADGSLTGTPGQFVIANNPLMALPSCQWRQAWNAYVCPDRFVAVRVDTQNGQAVAPLTLRRDDGATGAFVGVPNNPHHVSATVPEGRRYDVQFAGAAPSQPRLFAYGLAPGEFVQLVVPHPSASFSVYRDWNTRTAIPAAASMSELLSGNGGYYYDAGNGVIHLKMMAQSGRDWSAMFVAP